MAAFDGVKSSDGLPFGSASIVVVHFTIAFTIMTILERITANVVPIKAKAVMAATAITASANRIIIHQPAFLHVLLSHHPGAAFPNQNVAPYFLVASSGVPESKFSIVITMVNLMTGSGIVQNKKADFLIQGSENHTREICCHP